jgi:hypothetical protein
VAEATKKCPDCAETVLAEAKVCKHCGARFDGQPSQPKHETVYIERRGNGFAVAALAAGIVGLLFGLGPAILYVVPLAMGALALVFGLIGRRRANREPAIGRKAMATWGVALGIAGAITVENAVDDLGDELEQIDSSDSSNNSVTYDDCIDVAIDESDESFCDDLDANGHFTNLSDDPQGDCLSIATRTTEEDICGVLYP